MVHVHSITFYFHIVLGSPPPILSISRNIFLLFIDTTEFKIFNSLNITHVGVPSFSVGSGLGYVTSYFLYFFKDRLFLSNLDKLVVSARILASLGSVLVHSFAANMLFYF